jgi:hypothetical protein
MSLVLLGIMSIALNVITLQLPTANSMLSVCKSASNLRQCRAFVFTDNRQCDVVRLTFVLYWGCEIIPDHQ